jgi:galactose-1-phosphate uridylyltransferase
MRNIADIALQPASELGGLAASTLYGEMWLLPKHHQSDFGVLRQDELDFLARALRDALRCLSHALDDPPYNYAIDTAAKGASGVPAMHWRLRITTRVTVPAGFELGSGLPINPSLPEADAAALRSLRSALGRAEVCFRGRRENISLR